MSTSVMVAYRNPNSRSEAFSFRGAACFGTMNRLQASQTPDMDVMEWHPHNRGNVNANLRRTCTPRKAFNFINSFGMWEDIFHMTPINTVAAMLQESPMDAVITGFMSMRDFQQRYNSFVFPDGELNNLKIEFALQCAGIYRNRYNSPFLQLSGPNNGEGGVCSIESGDDALALYLLVYGTKEDFQGCWAQGLIGQGANIYGYVRNSSNDSNRRAIRNNRPGWSSMSCWLRTWIASRPEHLQDKLGRLTVRRFYDGLNARLNTEPQASVERKAELVRNAFEELRELYA